ncbi:MAG: LptF/LptG family permease [Flavobacteriales bacterium]|nr:LptF/LptG family permease [Flavobacteriales bacterium]
MKKLDRLLIRSFVGPFALTFFIAIFFLVMQFLWKYVDDLVGKGLEMTVIAELLLYASASLVPLALPLAILLSSIMCFGNLGEKYELAAAKASGISLQRLMSPIAGVTIIISLAAFYFSNNILPLANLKMVTLIHDVQSKKPALNIKPGIFYSGIEGYTIKVDKKWPDGSLKEIMIYDHTDRMGNTKVVLADSGMMVMSSDERYLILTLLNGHAYEEMDKSARNRESTFPFMRSSFEKEVIRFDLSSFAFARGDEELFKDKYTMLNLRQLEIQMDTLKKLMAERREDFGQNLVKSYFKRFDEKQIKQSEDSVLTLEHPDVLANFDRNDRLKLLEVSMNLIRSAKAFTDITRDDISVRYKNIVRHRIEYHRKFTLSIACMVLFFIGAPLGAIVRKGGLGAPMVLSVLFFLLYYIASIMGEKFARETVISPAVGMWLSTVVLTPIGLFLTNRATGDSVLMNADSYVAFFKKIFKRKSATS